MKIGGIQKLSLIDYPGKLACTIFLMGCNFRCPFCYNPELVLPEKIQKHISISEKDFFNFLRERKGMIEGVVLGGGEPTVFEKLVSFTKKIKKEGFLVKLDTNGSNPEMLEALVRQKLVDYIAMDVKAPKEKYSTIVGWKDASFNYLLEKIEKSIEILKENQIDYEFRTTVVPSLLEKEDILKIAQWIAGAKRYVLQTFQPQNTLSPQFQNIKPYPKQYLIEIQKKISPLFEFCEVR